MKGRNTFTRKEIAKLKELITLRTQSNTVEQKQFREEMRKLGFYGRDDWEITDLQVTDLEQLIESGKIIEKD